MFDKSQAAARLRATLPDNQDLDVEEAVEIPDGWVFFPQSKEYLRTRDIRFSLVGSGGVLIERETGRFFQFGSAFSLDENLAIYEAGYLNYEDWDIEVTKVKDLTAAAIAISSLNLKFAVPEFAHSETWRIPKSYNVKQIQSKLETLPARFRIGKIYFQWKVIDSLKNQRAFAYALLPNEGLQNSP